MQHMKIVDFFHDLPIYITILVYVMETHLNSWKFESIIHIITIIQLYHWMKKTSA